VPIYQCEHYKFHLNLHTLVRRLYENCLSNYMNQKIKQKYTQSCGYRSKPYKVSKELSYIGVTIDSLSLMFFLVLGYLLTLSLIMTLTFSTPSEKHYGNY
jgi:hypothetical protein